MNDFIKASLLVATCSALSGFYYDNGVDQTIVHKRLNNREKKEMQSEILHLLGLQHRPRPILPLSRSSQKPDEANLSSAPRFLIDVYQSLMEEDDGNLKLTPDLIEREFNVSHSEVSTMEQADVIMSFINRGNKTFCVCFQTLIVQLLMFRPTFPRNQASPWRWQVLV